MTEEKIEFKAGDRVRLIKHCDRGDPPGCDDRWTEYDKLQVGAEYIVDYLVPDVMSTWFALRGREDRYFYPGVCFVKVEEPKEPRIAELAVWTINLKATCPSCKNRVDLLDDIDFWKNHPNLEMGEHGTDQTKNMSVVCPMCGESFLVDAEY